MGGDDRFSSQLKEARLRIHYSTGELRAGGGQANDAFGRVELIICWATYTKIREIREIAREIRKLESQFKAKVLSFRLSSSLNFHLRWRRSLVLKSLVRRTLVLRSHSRIVWLLERTNSFASSLADTELVGGELVSRFCTSLLCT